MPDAKPIVYILRGDDREAIETHIHTFFDSLGTPDVAEMNITRLEGGTASMNDLRSAALALPFLTERRLVVLEDAMKLVDEDRVDALTNLFDQLPQSTALVLVVEDFQKNRKQNGEWITVWANLHGKHWLTQWAQAAGERALIVDCPLPSERKMPGWIRNKAASLGGSFNTKAAGLLAEFVGSNTQRAVQEIVKLLTYVNYARPVDDDDVRLLTIQEHQSGIFDMVDAIGSRDGSQAIELLHRILEESDLPPVFGMIVRQFRLLLQAREIMDEGGDERRAVAVLKQKPFVIRKIWAQTRLFTLSELERIYQLLHEMDVAMKTGGIDGETALDMFITRVTRRMV